MSAIESCRTSALGGHVARCEDCAHTTIAYSSCRSRHCPKCQGAAARQWMAAREAELLPIALLEVVLRRIDQIAREREVARIRQDRLTSEFNERPAQSERLARALKKETKLWAAVEGDLTQVLRRTVTD